MGRAGPQPPLLERERAAVAGCARARRVPAGLDAPCAPSCWRLTFFSALGLLEQGSGGEMDLVAQLEALHLQWCRKPPANRLR